MIQLNASLFPPLGKSIRASWAPVLLKPILGSPEQLVIAVAAANAHGFHIEGANALRRLGCLYGRAADTAIAAAEIALFELETRLATDGPNALGAEQLVFSSVTLGVVSEGEAQSLQSLARTWMGALSSLYQQPDVDAPVVEEDDEAGGPAVPDRLPSLVFAHVSDRRPGLRDFFSDEIKKGQQRRSRSITKVSIDFAGSHLVANFATLRPSQRASSVDRIKRKVFDLIVKRDDERGGLASREHEMIVFSPAPDDPTFSLQQINHFAEDLAELADQSDRENILFRTASSILQIADRVFTAEHVH